MLSVTLFSIPCFDYQKKGNNFINKYLDNVMTFFVIYMYISNLALLFFRKCFYFQDGLLSFNIFTKLLAIFLNIMVNECTFVDTFSSLFFRRSQYWENTQQILRYLGNSQQFPLSKGSYQCHFFHIKMYKYFRPNVFNRYYLFSSILPSGFFNKYFYKTKTHQISIPILWYWDAEKLYTFSISFQYSTEYKLIQLTIGAPSKYCHYKSRYSKMTLNCTFCHGPCLVIAISQLSQNNL